MAGRPASRHGYAGVARTVRHHRGVAVLCLSGRDRRPRPAPATGAFLENHCTGFGTNSTPNHLLIVGGQSPTLKNPSRRQPPPLWDMPSVPGLAEANGVAWRAYAASNDYPVGF